MTKKKAKKASKKKKSNAGRPQKLTFDAALLACIEQLARDGKTNRQIAETLGITEDTFYRYKKQIEQFSEALENGKSLADAMVEHSMFARALGCTTFEEKPVIEKGVVVDVIRLAKQHPPDVNAGKFWLTNRKKNDWKDRVEQEVRVAELEPVIIEDDEGKTTTLTMKEADDES
jgi:hypothetical protein